MSQWAKRPWIITFGLHPPLPILHTSSTSCTISTRDMINDVKLFTFSLKFSFQFCVLIELEKSVPLLPILNFVKK